MNIFYTADTHFGDEVTFRHHRQIFPFPSVKDVDKYIIDRWNSRINPNDVVYHLGDVGDVNCVKYLNGRITLVAGNHDNISLLNASGLFRKVWDREQEYIWEFQSEVGYYNMVHEPSKMRPGFNLFGHIHRLQMVKKFRDKKDNLIYGLNVSTDAHWLTPVSASEVHEYRCDIEGRFDEEVWL